MNANFREMLSLTIVALLMIVFLGVTQLAYIKIPVLEQIYTMDLALVPVLICAMIGISRNRSYLPSIVLGLCWAMVTLWFGDLEEIKLFSITYSVIYISTVKVLTTLLVAKFYHLLLCKRPGNRFNVFIAPIVAIVLRAVISSVLLLYFNASINVLIRFSTMLFTEISVTTLFLASWIKKLRELHYLNGIDSPIKEIPSLITVTYKVINKIFKTDFTEAVKPQFKEELR